MHDQKHATAVDGNAREPTRHFRRSRRVVRVTCARPHSDLRVRVNAGDSRRARRDRFERAVCRIRAERSDGQQHFTRNGQRRNRRLGVQRA